MIRTLVLVGFAFAPACIAAAQEGDTLAPGHITAQAQGTAVADPPFHLSQELIVKELRPIERFVSGKAKTTLATLPQAIGQTFMGLLQQGNLEATRFTGPAIFIYRGSDGAPNTEFDFSAGFQVLPDEPTPQGFEMSTLPAFRCATLYYTGSLANLPQAWQTAMEKVTQAQLRPTGEQRELYLYWEDPQSPNNVIEIQIGVAE